MRSRHPQETELVAAARGGSRGAYAELVECYQRPLFRFLRMRTASVEDAEEAMQEAFLRGWTQLDRFDPARSFSAWVYTLAARIAISQGRRRSLPVATERELDEIAGGVDPAKVVAQGDADRSLWSLATRVLGEDQRSALWLAYAEGRTTQEIGRILGKREVSIRVMLCRARRRLAPHLPLPVGCEER